MARPMPKMNATECSTGCGSTGTVSGHLYNARR
jgi:hypothetical protein